MSDPFTDIVRVTAMVRGRPYSELLDFLCRRYARKHGVISGIQQGFRSCFFSKFHR